MAPEARAADTLELALGALGRKERTTAELASWLAERGCESQQVDEAIAQLTGMGELDDERFARRYMEDKRDLSGWGPERIRGALLGRGVDADLVESTLAGEGTDEQVERAAGLLSQRGETLGGDAERGRAFGFLTRRGYDHEVAYAAIRRAAGA